LYSKYLTTASSYIRCAGVTGKCVVYLMWQELYRLGWQWLGVGSC